jgi:hypothetical protein
MPYAGKAMMPRDVAREARQSDGKDWGWLNYELTKAVAVSNAESHCYLGAYHDNIATPLAAALERVSEDGQDSPLKASLYERYGPPSVDRDADDLSKSAADRMHLTADAGGQVLSRDCGIYQFNIPANEIGSDAEFALRTESRVPSEYMPVFQTSVRKAWDYYNTSWRRGGKPDIRRWQAWAAYTSGWATYPRSWVWHHDENGNGVGPWVQTGRYIFNAIAGQMNNLIVNEKLWSPETAMQFGNKYATHFGITLSDGKLGLGKDSLGNMILRWTFPDAPKLPPIGAADYPVPNDGT